MQTYLIRWQIPDQEEHMKENDVFAHYVESGYESDKFTSFLIINRVENLRSQRIGGGKSNAHKVV